MIQVRNLTKTFDGFAALQEASLTVPRGSVYGLVGPNGAGTSTLIRHLTGIYRPDSGEITIDGEPVWENASLKARVAVIPDDWYYFSSASIRDMMRFYRGFYPRFSMERYQKLGEIFRIDEKRTMVDEKVATMEARSGHTGDETEQYQQAEAPDEGEQETPNSDSHE